MPAVLLQFFRKAEAGTLFSTHAPSHACAFDPAVQSWQVAFLYTKPSTQGRDIEQVEDLADRETTVRKFEQVLDGDQ